MVSTYRNHMPSDKEFGQVTSLSSGDKPQAIRSFLIAGSAKAVFCDEGWWRYKWHEKIKMKIETYIIYIYMTLDDKETHSGEANQDPTGPIMPWSHSNLPRRLVPSSQRLTPCCCRVSSKLSSQFSWDGWGKLQGRKPETFLGDKHRPSAWKRLPFVYTIYIYMDINWFSYIYTIIIYVYILYIHCFPAV